MNDTPPPAPVCRTCNRPARLCELHAYGQCENCWAVRQGDGLQHRLTNERAVRLGEVGAALRDLLRQ